MVARADPGCRLDQAHCAGICGGSGGLLVCPVVAGSANIPPSREHRRAKTDRLDTGSPGAAPKFIRAASPKADSPETRYARSGALCTAYQVLGDGPFDLVFVPGFISYIESYWEMPEYAQLLGRLATFWPLIVFDQHGTIL
jgi:hypothetical protein